MGRRSPQWPPGFDPHRKVTGPQRPRITPAEMEKILSDMESAAKFKVGDSVKVVVLETLKKPCHGVVVGFKEVADDARRRSGRPPKRLVVVRLTSGEELELTAVGLVLASVLETLGEAADEES